MRLDKLFRYGSKMHTRIVELIRSRNRLSLHKMQDRHSRWRQDEEAFLFYMPEKENDRLRRSNREAGDPQFTTIKIPYDYAALMSAHTYWTSVFLGRDPVFQYSGREGQSQNAVLSLEALIHYQMTSGRNMPPLYIWLLDVGKYGMGVVGDFWDKEMHVCAKYVDVEDEYLGVPLGTTRKELRRVRVDGYKGNRLYNVRPYDFFPDPRVNLNEFQKGEFCARHIPNLGWNEVLKRVAAGKYFNLKYLQSQRARQMVYNDQGSPQVNRPLMPTEASYTLRDDMTPVHVCEMYIELIPSMYKLGNSSYPETWVFTLANDEIIIGAQPLGLYHNKFPFSVLELEPDGYAMFKRSMFEISKPMTDVMTWLMNTHFYNTRKSINDSIIVDPTKVVMKDLLSESPRRIVRLKPEAHGQDIRSFAHPMPVQNVTQAHVADTQNVAAMLQRITGVNDAMMGLAGQKGRQTATEIRTSSTFGVNRMKTVAEWFSATGFSDLSFMLVANTQQLYDDQMKLQIAGDLGSHPGARGVMQVTPEAIAGKWDFVPVDGTLPIDRFAQVNMWTQLLQQMSQSPQVMQTFDMAKVFSWVAQLGGLKNVNQFKLEIADPATLQAEAQAGNVVPLNGNQPGNRNAAGANGETPVPRQVAGVGPSG